MKYIDQLQYVVIDKDKIAELVKSVNVNVVKELMGIKDGQVSHLRSGTRNPSANGLLRLMLFHNVSAEDIATVKAPIN